MACREIKKATLSRVAFVLVLDFNYSPIGFKTFLKSRSR